MFFPEVMNEMFDPESVQLKSMSKKKPLLLYFDDKDDIMCVDICFH
jgi:hypothetical protein